MFATFVATKFAIKVCYFENLFIDSKYRCVKFDCEQELHNFGRVVYMVRTDHSRSDGKNVENDNNNNHSSKRNKNKYKE